MSVLRFDPFGDPFRQMDRMTNQLLSGTRTPMGMPMDVWQADDGSMFLDLPGVDPDSVDITTERNILTITAERRAEYQQGQNVVIAERPNTFTRQLQLGETVDTENIEASYGDGVLRLTIPITQAAQPRVQVRTDSSGQHQVTVEVKPKNRRPLLGRPRTAVRRTPAPRRRNSSCHSCSYLDSTAHKRPRKCSTWARISQSNSCSNWPTRPGWNAPRTAR